MQNKEFPNLDQKINKLNIFDFLRLNKKDLSKFNNGKTLSY
jgi:hypothetical protein